MSKVNKYAREYLAYIQDMNIPFKDVLDFSNIIRTGFLFFLKERIEPVTVAKITEVSNSTVYYSKCISSIAHEEALTGFDYETGKESIKVIIDSNYVINSFMDLSNAVKGAVIISTYRHLRDYDLTTKFVGCSINTTVKWMDEFWEIYKPKPLAKISQETTVRAMECFHKGLLLGVVANNEGVFIIDLLDESLLFKNGQEKELIEYLDKITSIEFIINSEADINKIKEEAVIKLSNGQSLKVVSKLEVAFLDNTISIEVIRNAVNKKAWVLPLLQGCTVVQSAD